MSLFYVNFKPFDRLRKSKEFKNLVQNSVSSLKNFCKKTFEFKVFQLICNNVNYKRTSTRPISYLYKNNLKNERLSTIILSIRFTTSLSKDPVETLSRTKIPRQTEKWWRRERRKGRIKEKGKKRTLGQIIFYCESSDRFLLLRMNPRPSLENKLTSTQNQKIGEGSNRYFSLVIFIYGTPFLHS